MSWSPQQLAAIETRGKNILVAAAAGSGKTSVLVERIIRRVLDEIAPLDVDKILVVTFTNAAASEMRSRIAAALTEALAHSTESRHIERQLVLLNSASISTLHAFCQTVVRQNFHMLDLDPKFRIAGEGETALLRTEVMETLFEGKYARADEDFLQLVEAYGNEQSDEGLHRLTLGLYDFSRSHPWPKDWLSGLQDAFMLPAGTDIETTPWSELVRRKLILDLEQARHSLLCMRQDACRSGLEAYDETFADDQEKLEEILAAAERSWGLLEKAINDCEFKRMAAAPKGTAEEIRKPFQHGRKKALDKIKEFKSLFFSRTVEEFLEDMRLSAPLTAALADLVAEFSEEFTQAKREKGLVDFSDLEHYCLEILRAPESTCARVSPSPVAVALYEKYEEVMVDEYQDTNSVQEAILKLLASPEHPNRFMVGDVKQSIYRFRLAEPKLFLEKYRSYLDGENGVRIDLSQNFRSRAGVLHAVNFLFRQVMTAQVAELEYGEAEKLNPGPEYPEVEGKILGGPVEVCLIDRDKEADAVLAEEKGNPAEQEAGDEEDISGFEIEALYIARRIINLMEQGYQVYDKESKGYRRLTWRDMVILLRSVKGKADILVEALRREGAPVYAEIDSGYFRAVEVQVMLSVLSIIDNPCQDIPLAGALRSPVGGFTAPELARIRLCGSRGDLWEALQAAGGQGEEGLRDKVDLFVRRLEKWRDYSRRKGVPELIWKIYRDTGYYDYVGGMPGGRLRQANLRSLYDRARQYEATSFRGLFRFLRFVERLQDKGSDLAVARTLGEIEDVVRVMSIHKSKGLEFPVVFVADLGKNINLQDSRETILCHKDLGIGPYRIQPELRFRYPTLARFGISFKLMMETKAEELRILYVALTRAREKLILVGSASGLQKRATKWCQLVGNPQVSMPDWLVAGAKNYLDWLCPVLSRHSAGAVLREYAECDEEVRSGLFAGEPSDWKVEIIRGSELRRPQEPGMEEAVFLDCVRELQPVAGGTGVDWVEEKLGWQYAHNMVVGKPAKLSVTEIKRRFDLLDRKELQQTVTPKPIFARPRFVQDSQGLTGAEAGVILHSIMQHLQLREDMGEDDLHRQLADMVMKEILLEEHLQQVRLQSIIAFFHSALGRRLCRSGNVRRELPFSLTASAERFYPELAGRQETIFVQGVVDVLFDDPAGLVLLDYKTDHIHNAEELARRYKVQLELYAQAVETIYRRPVAEKYLYAFSLQQSIRL
jgi:ATP-dependent helicase/nuclease subunit A